MGLFSYENLLKKSQIFENTENMLYT